MKRLIIIAALLSFLLAACGAQATPTIDPAQVQASAMAAASTMIAQTQAAIPPTPVPTDTPQATPTPLASPTPFVLPTSVLASPTTSGSTASGDPCNAPLPANPPGQKTIIMIQNNSGAQANVSIYLEKTKFGQCGYRGYQLPKGGSVTITDLTYGQYYLYVWINNPQKPKSLTGGGYISSPTKWTFIINPTNIHFVVP